MTTASEDAAETHMHQIAPYPEILEDLVYNLTYKPGWNFDLGHTDRGQGSEGLTLEILVTGPDSYEHNKQRSVIHYFPVPPAAFNERSWRWWLFQCVLDVERHEAAEFFTTNGFKPFAPNHGPGNDPYMLVEMGTWEDADTDFRGNRVHPEQDRPQPVELS